MSSLEFADKFPNVIKVKKPLHLFSGYLNYVSYFFLHLKQLCVPLYQRLKKKLVPWTNLHTKVVKQVKQKIKSLPCLGIHNPSAYMIVESDTSIQDMVLFFNKNCVAKNN